MISNSSYDPDYIDPDDPDSNNDIDKMMEDATGDEPKAGEPYSIAEEVHEDEADR